MTGWALVDPAAGVPAIPLSPGAERRLREARAILPAAALVWGGLFGTITWSFDPHLGAAVVIASVLFCLVPLAFWGRVRQRARWMCGLSWAGVLYLQFTFLCAGLAAVAVTASPWAAVGVGLVTLGLAAWRLPRDVRRLDAEWETHRGTNERDVLDLRAGTYDLERRFVPLTDGGRGHVVADARGAAGLAARFAPVVGAAAAGGTVLAAHGASDVRVLGIAVLSPVAVVWFTAALAQAVVHFRRLRGYERRLGRPILNR